MEIRDDDISIQGVCRGLAKHLSEIPPGAKSATEYQDLVLGAITAIFYPDLIDPRKEWEINDGRKRVDVVFSNTSREGFFSQRQSDQHTRANIIVVECKNYSTDIANNEVDQLLARFSDRRGRFGLLTCRKVDDEPLLNSRLRDAARDGQGYILVLTDSDIVEMLTSKASLDEGKIERLLVRKFRSLLE